MALEYPGELSEGAILHGLCRLLAPLHSTEAVDSYLAARLDTHQEVVVVLPRPTLALERQEALRGAFLSEARRLAALEHPHLLRVWMVLEALSIQAPGAHPREVRCPAMICERLEGCALSEALARRPRQPLERALAWLVGALEGLAALREGGWEGHGRISAEALFVADPEGPRERAVWVELGELRRVREGKEGAPDGVADLRALALLTLRAWIGEDLEARAKKEERALDKVVRAALAARAREERLGGAARAGLEEALLGALGGRWAQPEALLEALGPLLPGEDEAAPREAGAPRWVWALVAALVGVLLVALWWRPVARPWGAALSGCLPSPAPPPCPPLGRMRDGACPPEGMVFVPGGRFQVGLEGGEAPEVPVREAVVDDFLLDRREVTVGEWSRCVSQGGCVAPVLAVEPGRAVEGEAPISGVSWEQARRYCEGMGKRLPTGVEWERAARGGDGRRYPWGDEAPSCTRAVSWTPGLGAGCGRGEAGPVGSREGGASPYGALDMAGSVWEWVDAPRVGADGAVWGHEKRGGSWAEPVIEPPERNDRAWWEIQLRPSFWRVSPPGTGYHNTGFRCARGVQARR